ncbi:hypothetical protein MRBBS_3404 [Marinobacter sp. BSs20148]|nr:hypothetical protein MRBBS_3404 [Marinobacter sp. BSs20148]
MAGQLMGVSASTTMGLDTELFPLSPRGVTDHSRGQQQ